MQKAQGASPSKDQIKILKYLDDFDRQISSRRSSVALEQQLAALSKAYNFAQEKLLQTEKALMTESILLEKQRSVIDQIYKYALNQQIDEQGILYFLQQLEEDESNRQIYEDIVQIRGIINRKRQKGVKRHSQQEKLARQLQKQIAKLNQDNVQMALEYQKVHQSISEMQGSNQQLNNQLFQLTQKFSQVSKELSSTKALLDQERASCKQMREQLKFKNKNLEDLKFYKDENIQLKKRLSQFEGLLKRRLNIDQDNKENQIIEGGYSSNKSQIVSLENIDKKLEQLLKYRTQYKKMKNNNEQNQFLKKQVTLLKIFLSQQALKLFKQLQIQHLDCIQTQIRNLAVLEKCRLLKLQDCERDIWKYRIQLIREEETISQQFGRFSSLNHYNFKQGSSLTQTVISQQRQILKSHQGQVSDFDS